MAQVQKNDDIAPSLIKAVQDAVNANVRANNRLTELRDLIENGWATYADAAEYALEYGNMVKQAMAANVSSAVLPDGKMYWNIADRLFDQIMAQEFSEISQQCEQVQTALNQAAGLGVKAQVPEMDPDRIKGLKEYASRAEQYDDVKASTENALVTYSQSIVDESVKKNADFQAKAGMHPRIIRRAAPGCCDRCADLAGSYDYPEDAPKNIFERHANCNCVVEYDPGSGKRQDVYTKVWKTVEESDKQFNDKQKQVILDKRKEEEKNKRDLLKKIDAGEISLIINHEKQMPHLKENDKKSYFIISETELQDIVNKYHGTGIVKYNGNNYKEIIDVGEVIGYNVNSKGEKEPVGITCIKIHYSKKRTHVVPKLRKDQL